MKSVWVSLLWATLAFGEAPKEVRLNVSDVESALTFYRDTLGLSLIYQSDSSAILDGGAFQLRLVSSWKPQAAEKTVLTLKLENLDRKRRELMAAGVVPSALVRRDFGQAFSIVDPNGYRIEFQTVFSGVWKRSIPYVKWDNMSLALDAFIPSGKGPFPAIVLVHGGGFTGGDRQTFVQPLLDLLAGTGRYALFTISYRLAPKHRYPKAVEDVQEALRFVRENAATFKVDVSRMGLVGESAGGYLVSMASTRLRAPEQVQAVAAFYGAHDLPARVETQGRIASSIKAFLGVGTPDANTMKVLQRASPVSWVRPDAPPHLLIHGTEDEQVPFSQSTRMCERMAALNAKCLLLAIEGGRHGMRGWDMDVFKTHYKDALLAFLDEYVMASTVPQQYIRLVTEEPGQ